MKDYSIYDLEKIAKFLRYTIIDTLVKCGAGHPGGSLSAADVLTALYFKILNINPKFLTDPDRDRFILSKGHSALGLFSVLKLRGFISDDELLTFRQDNSKFWGHTDIKNPGVELSAGSLGHGLSVGVGKAIAAKLDGKTHKIFVMLGDGECQEGSVWEAAMSAAHYKLDNLVAIVDRNMVQQCGNTEQVMSLEPFPCKWKAFGWNVIEIDGHCMKEIVSALSQKSVLEVPTVIISKTVKGKGISFMEDDKKWHGGGAIKEYADKALKEVESFIEFGELLND